MEKTSNQAKHCLQCGALLTPTMGKWNQPKYKAKNPANQRPPTPPKLNKHFVRKIFCSPRCKVKFWKISNFIKVVRENGKVINKRIDNA